MDIAYYISDLLGQQGELSVPNLGYFVQIRMPAYYDSEAKKFYPPHFSIQFDPQVIDDDDSLSAYIAGLKKISLASAKYFIEKYIGNLKSQAVIEDVPFANLGAFSSDGIKLSFIPGVKTDAPAFFALHPVEAYHINEEIPVKESVIIQDEPTPAPYISPEPTSPGSEITEPSEIEQPFESVSVPPADVVYPPNNEPEYIDEDVPATRSIGAWSIILIVLTIAAITLVALHRYQPNLFKEWVSLHKNPYTSKQPIVPPAVKQVYTPKDTTLTTTTAVVLNDTTAKTTLKKDTAVKVPVKTPAKIIVTPPVKTPAKTTATQPVKTSTPVVSSAAMPDDIPAGWWVIYGGAFPVRSLADKAINNYKGLGYTQARLLTTNVKRGNNYKIILGAYKTKAEATDASKVMLMTHKISISVEQLK